MSYFGNRKRIKEIERKKKGKLKKLMEISFLLFIKALLLGIVAVYYMKT